MELDRREDMRAQLILRARYLKMAMEKLAPDVIVANELRLIAKFGAIYLGKEPSQDAEVSD